MDAAAWLATERSLIDRDEWMPPKARKVAEARREREQASNTVKVFAKRYLEERGLRPNTVRGYESLLASRILPYFGEMPLRDVTLSEIKGLASIAGPVDHIDQRRGVPTAALIPARAHRGPGRRVCCSPATAPIT